MSETLTEATTYIEQGHVRVGPHAVTDPAVSGKDFLSSVQAGLTIAVGIK